MLFYGVNKKEVRLLESRVRSSKPLVTCVLLAALLVGSRGAADTPIPIGPQFQVNTVQENTQSRSSVVWNPSGQFLVVWESVGVPGPDLDMSLQAQLLSPTGESIGGQFRVNSLNASFRMHADLCVDSAGNYVAVWRGPIDGAPGTSGVLAARIGQDGVQIGSEIAVVLDDLEQQLFPSVASFSDGSLIVVWQDGGSTADSVVRGRIVDPNGELGEPFLINTVPWNQHLAPSVEVTSQDRAVVTWTGGDALEFSRVLGRLFDSGGNPVTEEFLVDTASSTAVNGARVSSLPLGGFVIVWTAYGDKDDSSRSSVHGRVFDSAGQGLGPSFLVNSHLSAEQQNASVSATTRGDFVVVWESWGTPRDQGGFSIQAQLFEPSGSPKGVEFGVNNHTPSTQNEARVAMATEGDFLVSFTSFGSSTGDPDFGIQARLFQTPLFVDGFESGDLGSWSSSTSP